MGGKAGPKRVVQPRVKWGENRDSHGEAALTSGFAACVAGGFGGRESRAETSGAAAGEMGREPRQSRRSRVNERLRRGFLIALAPFPPGFATRFGSRAQLSGEPKPPATQARPSRNRLMQVNN